jgi:hypothetical protein
MAGFLVDLQLAAWQVVAMTLTDRTWCFPT